jgi:outer membrane protein
MRKNSFIKTGAVLSVLFLINSNVNAQTKNEFSLQQCVEYGLKNSISVKNAMIDIQNQEQQNREITGQALPQLKANGNFTDYLNIPLTPIPGALVQQPNVPYVLLPFTEKYSSIGGLTLNQTIFDGQVFVGLQARSTAIALMKKTEEVTEEQIKVNIYKIYYQLIVGEKQLESVQANINDVTTQLHNTNEMYKNGFVERLDINKLTVQLNNLQTQDQSVTNELAAGNAGLKFLIGMPQKDSLELTDSLSEDELKADVLDGQYNYTDRKDVQALILDTKLNSYNIKRYQLTALPVLSAVANYSKQAYGSDFNFYQGDWITTSYVGVNLSFPLFDGNQRRAKLQEARYTVAKLQNNLDQLKQSVDNDVAQARINMSTALATIDNQKQNTQLAEQVYTTTQKKYEQGLGSNQEIYDAQTQLEMAQSNYYTALYDAIIAKINYLQATGKL